MNSSASSLDEFLQDTPEFAGYALGTSANNGNNGVKMVDLRGLGHKRTLILINGRRQVGSFVGGSLDLGAVDLNTIPMGMVERVEVLKDGASSDKGGLVMGLEYHNQDEILAEDRDWAEFATWPVRNAGVEGQTRKERFYRVQ